LLSYPLVFAIFQVDQAPPLPIKTAVPATETLTEVQPASTQMLGDPTHISDALLVYKD